MVGSKPVIPVFAIEGDMLSQVASQSSQELCPSLGLHCPVTSVLSRHPWGKNDIKQEGAGGYTHEM